MSSTTVPDVKKALLEMMRSIPELTNADVQYAEKAERRRNSVWMGETVISEVEPAGFRSGRSRRHESFTVQIVAEAQGLKPEDAEDNAYRMARAIEEALSDDPKVNRTPNLSWAFVEQFQSDTAEAGDGAFCQVELIVRCQGSFL